MTTEVTPFTGPLNDLAVLSCCLTTHTTVTSAVIEAVWVWFSDVDIPVPLPVMEMTNEHRHEVATLIVADLVSEFRTAEQLWEAADDDAHPADVAPEQVRNADILWRELAGCYAQLVNEQVPTVEFDSPEEEAAVYSSIAEDIANNLEIPPTEVHEYVATNPSFRLLIRRSGLDPDRI